MSARLPVPPSILRSTAVTAAWVLLALGAWETTRARVVGFYHDDAIYLSTAESLARTSRYRLVSLPGTPPQTKYVPLYPALLSVAALADTRESQIAIAKAINCALYATACVMVALLLLQLPHICWYEAAPLALVFALSPGVLTYTDFVLTETLYLTLIVAFFFLATVLARSRAVFVLPAVAAAAALTRPTGLALVFALAIQPWPGRARFRAIAASLAPFGAWALWCQLQGGGSASPLLSYYTRYETSLYLEAFRKPAYALAAWWLNVRTQYDSLPFILGPTSSWLIPLLPVLFGAAWFVRPAPAAQYRALVLFSAVHQMAVLGHPFPMARYLTPWVLTLVVTLALTFESSRRIGGVLARRVVLAAVVVLLAGNTAWTRFYCRQDTGRIHAEFGFTTPFGWSGFLETAQWLRQHTPPGSVVASGYDSFYYLYADRQGIRPWIHVASTPLLLGHGLPTERDRDAVAAELRRLHATYVVVDPFLRDPEGRYYDAAVERVLSAPADRWDRVFQSADGLHTVWRRTD